MRIIRWSSLVATPWKNGGGVTRQIACFPEGSGLDGFDWRISTATVSQDGDFSRFEGIDRRLYVLDGAGLELRFAAEVRRLLPGEHTDFSGDVAVHGRLMDGPVTDLNIMVRRDRLRASFGHVRVAGTASVTVPGENAALFVVQGEISIAGETAAARDTVLFDVGHAPDIVIEGTAELIVIGFEKLP